MIVGMVVLGPIWSLGLDASGAPALDRPELNALAMATNMTIAMSAWMRYRGHRWGATAEMAAAMYVPFIVLFIPLWLGLLSPSGLIILGHALMLAGMATVMLLPPPSTRDTAPASTLDGQPETPPNPGRTRALHVDRDRRPAPDGRGLLGRSSTCSGGSWGGRCWVRRKPAAAAGLRGACRIARDPPGNRHATGLPRRQMRGEGCAGASTTQVRRSGHRSSTPGIDRRCPPMPTRR